MTTETINPGAIDMEEELYHRHPTSLSTSGAKKLLPPSTPAEFQWDRLNPQPPKPGVLEFGKAAHAKVLGTGPELVVVRGFDDWRTKAAREAADEIRDRGAVPLLEDQYEAICAMEKRLREHPVASTLLDPERGKAEQSLFWTDPETSVERRARLDWLPDRQKDGRLIVPDFKTAASANPFKFAKAAADFHYEMQDDAYLTGLRECGLDDGTAAFVFVVQAKTPPYVVSVVQLDQEARDLGGRLNRQALEIFRTCTERDEWPAYPDPSMVSLPYWFVKQYEL